MIVPVCVVECVSGASVLKCASSVSEIACVSACMEMDGPIQMGDECGEPPAPCKVILVTAPVPRDAAYEAVRHFADGPRTRDSVEGFRWGTSRVSKETVARTVKMAASVV